MTERKIKIATVLKVINRKLQLFDKAGRPLSGRGTKWSGDFYCCDNQLTSLEGAPESVGGGFYCSGNQLTSLEGAPESVGGGFYCYGNQLTSLEGAPESVGGDFYCSGNQLTSLEGAPESVGGDFYCSGNQLTSLEGAPKENEPQGKKLFEAFLKKGLVFFDGILLKKISVRVKLDVTIYKTAKLGFRQNPPIVYVCAKGEYSAHGETAKEAMEELLFKSGDRNIEEYRNMPMNTKKTPNEWAFIYRVVTGACQYGVKDFMSHKKLKKNYTLEEIINETRGAFGHESFVSTVMSGG